MYVYYNTRTTKQQPIHALYRAAGASGLASVLSGTRGGKRMVLKSIRASERFFYGTAELTFHCFCEKPDCNVLQTKKKGADQRKWC